MIDFKNTNDSLYMDLLSELTKEGYSQLSVTEKNKIYELLSNEKSNDSIDLAYIVKKSIDIIRYLRSANNLEGFQCGHCGREITLGTNAGTGRCIECEKKEW